MRNKNCDYYYYYVLKLQGKNVRESAKTHRREQRLTEERLLKTLPNKEQRPYYIRQGRAYSSPKTYQMDYGR
jgi:hypothetical protein